MSRSTVSAALRRLATSLALAGLLLAGCARPTPTPEPVSIRFAHPEADSAYYQALLGKFRQAHPGVTVNLLPMATAALARLGPGDADVLVATTALTGRARRGDLLSLSPWIERDEAFQPADYYPGLIALYTSEGRIWGVPVGVDLWMLHYNRDLFDRAGAPYPRPGWTWEDWLGSARTVRNRETGVYGYAAANHAIDSLSFIYQHGGRILDDWRQPTRPTLDDPRTIEALEWYAALVHRHGVMPGPDEVRQQFGGSGEIAVGTAIYAGRVAMWAAPYSARGGRGWPRPWPFNWGVAPLPRGQQSATWGTTEALAISSQARRPEACWQWFAFLSRQAPSRLAPARRSVAQGAAFEQQAGPEAAAAVRASLEQAMFIPPDLFTYFAALGRLWERAVDEVISGQATAREALTRAQAQAGR